MAVARKLLFLRLQERGCGSYVARHRRSKTETKDPCKLLKRTSMRLQDRQLRICRPRLQGHSLFGEGAQCRARDGHAVRFHVSSVIMNSENRGVESPGAPGD